MTTPAPHTEPRPAVSFALDLVGVIVFVSIGVLNHDTGFTAENLGRALWPFLVGLAVGWLLILGLRRAHPATWSPQRLGSGVVCVVSVMVVGMLLRWASGQGTALAFVIVATASTAILLLGWRVAALAIARGKRTGGPAGPS